MSHASPGPDVPDMPGGTSRTRIGFGAPACCNGRRFMVYLWGGLVPPRFHPERAADGRSAPRQSLLLRGTPMIDSTRLLQDLVRLPSVNPMARHLRRDMSHEHRVTAYLTDFCRGLAV